MEPNLQGIMAQAAQRAQIEALCEVIAQAAHKIESEGPVIDQDRQRRAILQIKEATQELERLIG